MWYNRFMVNYDNNKEQVLLAERKIRDYCLEHQIERPPGSLRIDNREGGPYYSVVVDGKKRAVHPGEPELIERQRWRLLDELCGSALNNIERMEMIERMTAALEPTDPFSIEAGLPDAYKGQLTSEMLDELGFVDPAVWADLDYPRYQGHPEKLTHKSARGIMMRSRAEVGIANLLDYLRYPYRYEQIIYLADGRFLVPDFTILDPVTNNVKYLEHCGMMNDPEYSVYFVEKYYKYIEAGIIPNVDILFTFDSGDGSFNLQRIKNEICRFMGYRGPR